jgi:predicted amidohydrolase YtcJ
MMRLAVAAALCCSVAIGSLFAQQDAARAPDQIFYNGKIATVDSSNSIQEAFAVKGDKFLAVGGNKEIQALKGPQTQLVDLRGRTVIPGLQDNHIHPYRYVTTILRGVDLTGVRSLADISDRIRQAAEKAKPDQAIYATGRWSETDLSEKRGPTREELDSLVAGHPVLILQRGGNAYLNTAALKAARIDRTTRALGGEPGSVPKDAHGEPTGVIVDSAEILVARLVPMEQLRELTLKTFQELNALGFTSIREPSLQPEIMRLYWSVHEEGKLTLRISMGRDLGPGEADDIEQIVSPIGVKAGSGNEWLKYDSLGEFSVDGGWRDQVTSTVKRPGGQTASVTANISAEKFRQAVIVMNRLGWRPAPHVNADDALDLVLDGYEAANREKSIRDKRWVLEHASMIRPDQIDRSARLGVVISAQFQPYRGGANLMQSMARYVGKKRVEDMVPMRDMLDRGLIVSAGSDWAGGPINNPFIPFYFNVTRKTDEGLVIGAAQRISRTEALRVSTINNAYLTYEEKTKGSIEPGKLADFVILSRDILTVPEEQIRSTQPVATYVGGRKVFGTAEGS